MKELPTLKWSIENNEKGWWIGECKGWKVYVSNMILYYWIGVVNVSKNESLEITSSKENLDIAIQEATSLFYFHYTETKPKS